MQRTVRYLAVLTWWLSFVAPAMPVDGGGVALGSQLFATSTVLLFGLLPFSLLLVIPPASWLTNLLPLWETFRLFDRSGRLAEVHFAGGAFFINLVSYLWFLRDVAAKATPMYKYPAVYLWLCSFLLLWLSTLDLRRKGNQEA